ncbi:MAG: hypothetical protein ACHQT6_12135 [Candidatus Acidiferrales bacterium]
MTKKLNEGRGVPVKPLDKGAGIQSRPNDAIRPAPVKIPPKSPGGDKK